MTRCLQKGLVVVAQRLAIKCWWRHYYNMGREPAELPTPDRFSTDTVRAAAPSPTRPGATKATADPAPQRHILPKDLPNAVKYLSDGELGLLHGATLDEMNRRGRIPPSVETDLQTLRHRFNVRPALQTKRSSATDKARRRKVEIAEVALTRGQVNAVRAAFKAGITPSRIARQFGLSRSNVRKALASDESKQ
jgi:hypothetical protein